MKYEKQKDKILIDDTEEFDPEHILECGQVFRYKKIENGYQVFSLDKTAKILKTQNGYEILSSDIDYFENYFDLKTDYNNIKKDILKNVKNEKFMADAISYGKGIRILRQDNFEATISFLISQNNNIKRIQLIVEKLCEKYGTNIGSYYAFPTLKQLEKVSEDDYKNLGAGYRAKYLCEVVKFFSSFDKTKFDTFSFDEKQKTLLSVKGIGQKVCDCILLFGYYQMEVFPVDTWIEKVYREYFCEKEILTDRVKIRQKLVSIFKQTSGYAQQYLFYFQRSK